MLVSVLIVYMIGLTTILTLLTTWLDVYSVYSHTPVIVRIQFQRKIITVSLDVVSLVTSTSDLVPITIHVINSRWCLWWKYM